MAPFREAGNRYRFQMSLDRDSFLAALAGAVGGEPFDRTEGPGGGLVFTGRRPASPWTVRAVPLPPLTLGALTLPRLEVELDLAGQSAGAAEAFARRFLSHVQRAGG